jgi:hypothetical protein
MKKFQPAKPQADKGRLGAFIIGAALNLLFNMTAGLFGRTVAIRITRWGWLYFLLHATYFVVSGDYIRGKLIAFRALFGKRAFMSYLLIALICAGIGDLYWLSINKAYSRLFNDSSSSPSNGPSTQLAQVRLFLDCSYQQFPLTIPAGSRVLVLQAHPGIITKHLGLLEVAAPLTNTLTWPSAFESTPLPLPIPSKALAPTTFQGLKCILKKYGDPVSIEKIVIPIYFSAGWGNYDLIADPLESQGSFTDFTFYMINYCYSEAPPPGIIDPGSIQSNLVLGTFSKTATVQILGEASRRQIPISIPFRNNLQPDFILPGTYHRWAGFPPLK